MAVDFKKLNEILGEDFIKQPGHLNLHKTFQPTPVNKTDLAQYLLTHSFGTSKTIGKTMAAQQKNDEGGPSLLSRVFDRLYEPLYSVGISVERGLAQGADTSGDFLGNLKNEVSTIGKGILGGAERAVAENEIPVVSPWVQAIVGGGNTNKGRKILAREGEKNAPKMLSSDVIGSFKNPVAQNPVVKYGGGFALDVALDPLTYVPGLDIVGTINKGKKAIQTARGFRDITDAAAGTAGQKLDAAAAVGSNAFLKAPKPRQPRIFRPVAEEVSQRSVTPNLQVPKINLSAQPKPSDFLMAERNIPNTPDDLNAMLAMRRSDNARRAANIRHGNPEDFNAAENAAAAERYKADFADAMRDGKMRQKGIISDGKGTVSVRGITDVLQQIADGTIPRFGRTPDSATGEAANIARKVADDFIKKPGRKLGNAELEPADQANLYNSLRNKATEIVNKSFKEKPAPEIRPNAQRAFDYITDLLTKRKLSPKRAAVEAELDKLKYINKTDKRQVLRTLYPKESIKNYAATRPGQIAVQNLTRQMLRTAEDHLIAKGHNPVYLNGMRTRLSDVLEEVGPVAESELLTRVMRAMAERNPHRVTDPNVQAAINKVLGRRSLAMSDLLGELSDRIVQAKTAADNALIGPKARKLLDSLAKSGQEAVKELGATKEESKAIYDQLSNIVHLGDTPVDQVMQHIGPDTIDAIMSGRINAKELSKINRAIARTIGSSPEQMAKDVSGNKIIDGLATRFATVYGRQEELKKFSEDYFRYAEQSAAHRAQFFSNLVKKYPKETLINGFRIAQQPETREIFEQSDPLAVEVSQTFTDYFNTMLGSDGFKDMKDFAGTVAAKSQIVMTDINKQLKAGGAKFQFTDKKVPVKVFGKEDRIRKDYKNNWLTSWELADPRVSGQDPISFLYDMDLAIQRTTAEYRLYDDMAMRFGAKKTDAWFDPKVHKSQIPNPRLKDLYFHPEVRNEFLRLVHDLEQGAYRPNSDFMRFIGKTTRIWKSSVTIYYPSHHVRNLIGDNFNTWLAGYNDPTLGYKAAKVLMSQKGRYREALKNPTYDVLSGLIDRKALDLTEMSPGGATIIRNKKFGNITAEQIYASGYKRGLFISYHKIEDIFGEAPFSRLNEDKLVGKVLARLQQPFGGKAHDVATQISEYREHYSRLIHYIGAIEKYAKKYNGDLEKAYDAAAHEVRKWHPDGTDLTQFEQKIRYAIPFYAWTRKEIPLLMQAMIERPAKLTAYPKFQRNLAGALGIDQNNNEGMLDPFPDNQMFPYWIRASGIGPLGDPNSDNFVSSFWGKLGATVTNDFTGQPSGYTIVNPSDPFNDVVTSLFGFGRPQDIGRNLLSNTSPLINVPADLMMGQTFSGAPIYKSEGGQGIPSFLAQQLPQANAVTRVSGIGGKKREGVQNQNQQNIINILTALGLRGTGPYIKSAQFEAEQRANNQR